jgi:hypothetical protein
VHTSQKSNDPSSNCIRTDFLAFFGLAAVAGIGVGASTPSAWTWLEVVCCMPSICGVECVCGCEWSCTPGPVLSSAWPTSAGAVLLSPLPPSIPRCAVSTTNPFRFTLKPRLFSPAPPPPRSLVADCDTPRSVECRSVGGKSACDVGYECSVSRPCRGA